MVIRLKKGYKRNASKKKRVYIGMILLILWGIGVIVPYISSQESRLYMEDPRQGYYQSRAFEEEVLACIEEILEGPYSSQVTFQSTSNFHYVIEKEMTNGKFRYYSNIQQYEGLNSQVLGSYERYPYKIGMKNHVVQNYYYGIWYDGKAISDGGNKIVKKAVLRHPEIEGLYIGIPYNLQMNDIFSESYAKLLKYHRGNIEKNYIGSIVVMSLLSIGIVYWGYKKRNDKLERPVQLTPKRNNINYATWGIIGVISYFVVNGIAVLLITTELFTPLGYSVLVLWNGCTIIYLYCYGKSLGDMAKSIEVMARGDLSYQVEWKRKTFVLKAMAKELNQMSEGLNVMAQEAIRGERMRAELITNVSHDLKTPLTSIINYIGLLKKLPLSKEVSREVGLVDRETKLIKRRIEDVVEASKALTGKIEIDLQPISMVELVQQFVGEYGERLLGIPMELRCEEVKDMMIHADSRGIWRMLEILMNNVIDYGMPYSRVYIDVEEEMNYGVLTIKNMSKCKLNVDKDTLLKKIIEEEATGGMGLMIAESLANLQEGKLVIDIDGDLFKVKMYFLKWEEKEAEV